MNLDNHLPASSSQPENTDSIQIDFWKVFDFFTRQYQRLILGAGTGLIISLLAFFGLGTYKAQVSVPNQWGEIVSIRALEDSWATLAREIAVDSSLSLEDQTFYKTISSTSWWNKAVRPNYAVTKADLKDLVGSPEIKGAPIINLEVTWVGANADLIQRQLLKVIRFMRTASSFWAVRNIVINYEAENFTAAAAIERELHSAQLGLMLANRRLSNLEELQKRFPGNSLAANQVVDPKDSGAKYLPISTQIIAAKSDIFATQENIAQLQTRFEQTQLLTKFVDQAKPLLSKERNGIELSTQLLAIEAQLRVTISADDLRRLVVLDRIRTDLMGIQAQYVVKADQPLFPIVQRNSSWISASLGGLLGGFFITLLLCIGLHYRPLVKTYLQLSKKV